MDPAVEAAAKKKKEKEKEQAAAAAAARARRKRKVRAARGAGAAAALGDAAGDLFLQGEDKDDATGQEIEEEEEEEDSFLGIFLFLKVRRPDGGPPGPGVCRRRGGGYSLSYLVCRRETIPVDFAPLQSLKPSYFVVGRGAGVLICCLLVRRGGGALSQVPMRFRSVCTLDFELFGEHNR